MGIEAARWQGARRASTGSNNRRATQPAAMDRVRFDLPLPNGLMDMGNQHCHNVPGLHEDLDGLRIVQLSDPHGGCFVDEASLEPAVDLARALRPDVLAITGDFVTRRMEDARELGSVFGRIPAPLGRFAVFGNHDYRHRREGEIAAWLRRQGVVTLRNASMLVRRGAGRLARAGGRQRGGSGHPGRRPHRLEGRPRRHRPGGCPPAAGPRRLVAGRPPGGVAPLR